MKITGYQVDWKDEFEGEVIDECLDEVGGRRLAYSHDVSGWVDAKLMMFSSEPLSGGQRDLLWKNGDLGIADKVYDGTFDEVLAQLRDNLAEAELDGVAAEDTHVDDVLDTLEGFLDTCPALEGKNIRFEDRMTGENENVRTMRITIAGVPHLVVVKVGG